MEEGRTLAEIWEEDDTIIGYLWVVIHDVPRRHGYDHDVSAKDLLANAEADTIYPSAISWDEILKDRLIVVHEVVEIAELKRMGLEITGDVIVRNLEEIYEAHLSAAEVEMAIALEIGDLGRAHGRL